MARGQEPWPLADPIPRALVILMFFVSGVAGLLYQVVWVRSFALTLGNTIQSASIVTGVFMAGLGLGGLFGGALVDSAFRNDRLSGLRFYVWAEAAIAVLGIALAFLLPRLESLSAAISTYQVTASGWHTLTTRSYLLRHLIAVILLGPITTLMGSSLTLLIRALVQTEPSSAGWYVGWLYGFNTAGAALGSLLADAVWIPAFGIASAQGLAAGLNLVAALGGFAILRSLRQAAAPGEDTAAVPDRKPRAPLARGAEGARGRTLYGPMAAVFLSGLAGMGLEILWFRFLTSALGQYRQVFSLLLFVILCGIGAGSIAGGFFSRRTTRPGAIFVLSQVALACSTLASFFLFNLDSTQETVRRALANASGDLDRISETMIHLWAILRVAGLPSLAMGFAFPVVNALAQTYEARIGRRAGALYLGNTMGALSGSILTGFVFLPAWGMKWTTFLLVGLALAAVLPLATMGPVRAADAGRRVWMPATVAGGLLAFAGLVAWAGTPADYLLLKSFRAAGRGSLREYLKPPSLVAVSEGLLETAVTIDLPDRGRTLYTNGHIMSLTGYPAQRYMRAFVHLPLLHLERPEAVLVICFGVGNTAHAASLHESVRRIDVVDISENVLKQAPLFAATNGGVLSDPRVSVFVNDGRQHLRMQPENSFDLVTLEPPPISFSGVGSLYSKEFYALVRSRLKPDGFLSQWLPMRQVPAATLVSMIRAFVEVFPETLLLNGYSGDFLLVGRKDRDIVISPEEIESRLQSRPAVREDLARYDMASPVELLGTFAADGRHLATALAGTPSLVDDRPLMEYGPIYRERNDLPIGLIDVEGVRRWCPACFEGESPREGLADLTRYLAFMAHIYARYASPSEGEPESLPAIPDSWTIGLDTARDLGQRYGYPRRIMGTR